MEITVDTAKQLGLTEEEFGMIKKNTTLACLENINTGDVIEYKKYKNKSGGNKHN